ncbi:MAG TPA: RNA polymerase sigma factor [Planctomycetota bacterium]|nr:RNA polymerase sigma factor [Planctomycetota bacterium]
MANFVRFDSTVWDLVKRARTDQKVLGQIIESYRPPIYNFIRARGFNEHEAEDLTQEIFIRLSKEDVLGRLNPSRGRFRSFLLVITKNVIGSEMRRRQAEKRGGGQKQASIDEMRESIDFDVEGAADGKDEEFNRLWLQNLVRQALARLQEESERKKNLYYQALKAYLAGQKHEDVAKALDRPIREVRSLIHYGRAKLKAYVKELVIDYSSSKDDCDEELAFLSRYM